MKSAIRYCLLLAAVCLMTIQASAGHHGLCETCPSCHSKACCPEPTEITVENHCWEVECKDICIPKFKWPWDSCCEPPKCGKVRTVKVLKKVEKECKECGYKWTVKDVGCRKACDH